MSVDWKKVLANLWGKSKITKKPYAGCGPATKGKSHMKSNLIIGLTISMAFLSNSVLSQAQTNQSPGTVSEIQQAATTFPVDDQRDVNLLQRAEGAKLGNTTLPSGKYVPAPPKGKEWRVRNGTIVLEATKPVDSSETYHQKPAAEKIYAKGLVKEYKGDLGGAIADITTAIKIDPKFPLAYYNRGVAKQMKGDVNGAMDDYTKTIDLDPTNADSYFNRAILKQAKVDLDGAVADYTKAVELKPDYALAYNNRGNARCDNFDLDGAVADYTKAIELKPDYAFLYNNRGIAKKGKGDLDGAIADYTKAIELKPDFAFAYNNRSIAKRAKGDLDGAAADFKTAETYTQNLAVVNNSQPVSAGGALVLPGMQPVLPVQQVQSFRMIQPMIHYNGSGEGAINAGLMNGMGGRR